MTNILYNFFLKEDSPAGDITSEAIFPAKIGAKAVIFAKEPLILSGLRLVQDFLRKKFPQIKCQAHFRDGQKIKTGQILATLVGPAQKIFQVERILLNILQHLSGIATLTNAFVKIARPHHVKILDTRKTLPGWRELEKQAVKDGDGINHRPGLSDAYLIKDNHIAVAGSVAKSLEKVFAHRKRCHQGKIVEIEVKNLKQLREALVLNPNIILLDNMNFAMLRQAVRLRKQINKKVLLEISGGVTLKTLKKYVRIGVERISVGALTHSARAVDIAMDVKRIH